MPAAASQPLIDFLLREQERMPVPVTILTSAAEVTRADYAERLRNGDRSLSVWGDTVDGVSVYLPNCRDFDVTVGKIRKIASLCARDAGLRSYLTHYVPGIGKALASDIVSAFGGDTVTVLDRHPERLRKVEGVTPELASDIVSRWSGNRGQARGMLALMALGVAKSTAQTIVRHYAGTGVDVRRLIQKEPYRLLSDIPSLSFRAVDAVASVMGFARDCPERLRAAVSSAVLSACRNGGGTYVTEEELMWRLTSSSGLLAGVPQPTVIAAVEAVRREAVPGPPYLRDDIACVDGRFYPARLWQAEFEAARSLSERLMRKPERLSRGPMDFSDYERECGFELAPSQKAAVELVCNRSVSVMTGGPGTGKTTTTRAVIDAFERAGKTVVCAAFTGRASQRMAEATGHDAQTIFRQLGITPDDDMAPAGQAEMLSGDVLIIDEASMVDVQLFNRLLRSMPPQMKLILVGDENQLPSIAPGNILTDIIRSGCVPVARLDTVYRQSEESDIVRSAGRIAKGGVPHTDPEQEAGEKASDFVFIKVDRPSLDAAFGDAEEAQADIERQMAGRIVSLMTEEIPRKYGFTPDDIQVLSPLKRNSAIGADSLSSAIRDALGRNGDTMKVRDAAVAGVGDRVMQLVNDYAPDRDVRNGDVGTVISVTHDPYMMTVRFGDRDVAYPPERAADLSLAYACSIHKSQGSEYPVVIMPVSEEHARKRYLNRNLLYTGITRAKKLCILVGQEEAVKMAVGNTVWRKTSLAEKLSGQMCPTYGRKHAGGGAARSYAPAAKAAPQPAAEQPGGTRTWRRAPDGHDIAQFREQHGQGRK